MTDDAFNRRSSLPDEKSSLRAGPRAEPNVGSMKTAGMSVGTKLSLATVLVLTMVSGFLYVQLTRREREHLVSAKATAAGMVSDLFSASLSAAVVFNDVESIEGSLAKLKGNPEIITAAVWERDDPQPVARLEGAPGGAATFESGVTILDHQVEVRRLVHGPKGEVVGRCLVVFSLRAENTAFRTTRLQLLLYALLMAGGTAGALTAFARLQITKPLARLAHGARRLARGDLGSRVAISSRDEIGTLAEAFNAMGEALFDREERLEAARRRTRDLFDHMRQAILAFGPDGSIVGDASRRAFDLFGADLTRKVVRDILFPGALAHDVDARAFDEWAELAFDIDDDDWADFSELAPKEVVIRSKGQSVAIELEFRPVRRGTEAVAIMLLATDVSAQRRLERTVQTKEEEHARQMAAMRRLVAGGGQVFVQFIEGARVRIARCNEVVGSDLRDIESPEIEELFRHVHTIKGEAKAFDLRELEAEAARVEEELDELRARARDGSLATTGSVHGGLRAGLDRIGAAIDRGCEVFVAASPTGRAALDQVTVQRADLDELLGLVHGRSDSLSLTAARLAARPFGESTANLVDITPTWATREGKAATLEVTGKEVRIPARLSQVLGGVLTHLVRNAVAHGIELPAIREEAGKQRAGLISIKAEPSAAGPFVTVEDDGRGLDRKALEEAAALPGAADIEGLIFEAGVTTRAAVDSLAGRGVGLAAVRAELRRVGYDITVSHKEGQFTRFELRPGAESPPPRRDHERSASSALAGSKS